MNCLNFLLIKKKKKNELPERATISLAVKPLLEKEVMRALRFNPGPGSWLFAAVKLAVVASLLPRATVQLGPFS